MRLFVWCLRCDAAVCLLTRITQIPKQTTQIGRTSGVAAELQREADSLDEEEAVEAMGSGLLEAGTGTDNSTSFEGASCSLGVHVLIDCFSL